MRRLGKWRWWACLAILGASLTPGTAQVLKVLPQYLDREGRAARSPSLFDRDAYQAQLRRHPELRESMRFQILWRRPPNVTGNLKLRIELRGVARDGIPHEQTLEQPLTTKRTGRHWTSIRLAPDTFRALGDVVAWRVTLWSDDTLVGQQQSFLWDR
ncbi:hypothetical protein G4L39_01140 [Limisphaera ngatamarikiensis]|uniref:Uncharacterized protein n=1 Tax=Limisphaera ngatamarikiensis TaxID=1324935 RepID=A0A6M1RK30_9BACT|nr:hypothetical protein [Limisphaera ngatamarikiensis]NGO38003.1 hypothetical protein [Limisphaera ngatamarikiensis]